MLYIPKIENYLETLTEETVEDLMARIFGEYFESRKEDLYSKVDKETRKNLRKVAEVFYTFLRTSDKMEKFDELLDKLETKAAIQ